ncbi:splicing factor 3B subunit 1-like [Dorcoceras hygrometricum]|uniref:Splicing factor 3B subunit 1-like n=1 Tax=Dorcoceras hygrometricum TaxID=472368 RepID=A0A2Z7ATH6_9LAMI|nr:splicing factor 3B subunit 1-like [Dorcoceras hygrometricum]
MASFTTPKQLLQEPLKSREDDDMSGFKQPSKIIESAETEETDIEPVDTEELNLVKDFATMTESEDTGFLRTKTMVDGSWVIQEANDLWKRLPKRPVSLEIELSPQRQFNDTLAPHSSSSSSEFVHPDPAVFASISQRPLDTDLTSPNPSTTDSRIFFTADDTHMGVDQILMPTALTPQDFTEPLAQFRALVNQISTERVQKRDDSEKLKDMLLLEIWSLEKKVTEMLVQQDSLYRGLFNNMRQEIQIQKTAPSLDILASKQKLITQQAAVATGLDDIRKDVDETKSALSNALLEFHAQAQENYNNLSSQLGELVAYINRCGNDKKGEGVSSSRGTQPPPGYGGGSGSRSEPSRKRGSSGSRQKSWRYWLNE